MFFNWAQTLHLDKSAAKNATEVAITRVDLFFRSKPPKTNNKSGIDSPGVEVLIVPCLNGIPVINQMGAYRPTEPTEHGAKFAFYSGGQTARLEYEQIQASTNASIPATFLFDSPIFVHTDSEYAIIVKFDGNENFVLWDEAVGDILVGSGNICTGPSGNFTGKLFQFIDDINKTPGAINAAGYAYSNNIHDPAQGNNASLLFTAGVLTTEQTDTKYLQANWAPLPGHALKLALWIARYAINGQSILSLPDYWANSQLTSSIDRRAMHPGNTAAVSNGMLQLIAPVQTSEYLRFDMKNTTKDDLFYGEPFYQDGPLYPGGRALPLTVNCSPSIPGANVDYAKLVVIANGSFTYDNGSTFSASGGFNSILDIGDMVIFSVSGNNTLHFRSIDAINSNTEIVVDQPFDTTLTGANFRITPVGYLNDISQTYVFGRLQDLATLYNSTANSSVRFTSFSIANSTINVAGTGYANSDYIKIVGYEDIDTPSYAVKGNYAAYANVVTDGSGVITAVYLSNTGCGFTNSSFLVGANVNIYRSTAGVPSTNPSAGTSANISFTVSSNIKSLFKLTSLANVEVINIEAMRMKPEITVNNPLGSSFTIRHRTLYHAINYANSHNERAYYIDTPTESTHTDIFSKIFKAHNMGVPAEGKTPVITSRSNEFVIRYANGAVNNANTYGSHFSNTAVLIFDISSNSDYQAVYFDPEIVMTHYGKYIINDDYTNEHTNYGNAYAKHVATKINMATDRFSEDVLVYLTAYRPSNTDFKVYARLHNSRDADAFDDSDWTLLEQTDGLGMYSSKSNDSDYIELTYGLPAYPNTDYTVNGSVKITQGNNNIVGTGTIFGPMANVVSGGTGYNNNDIIYFTAPTGFTDDNDTGITASKASTDAKCSITVDGSGIIQTITVVDTGYGFTSQQAYTGFTAVTNTGVASAGSAASLKFTPGLQPNDLIKIYSYLTDFANTNYTTAVVNNVASNTSLIVKRAFGELGANQVGTVAVNTTSTTFTGTNTLWNLQFDVGDYIAYWANSTVYEARKIVTIVSNTSMTVDANASVLNTGCTWAHLKSEAFLNVSTAVSGLLIDRIAYPHQAFNNMQNDNVSRYYNSSMIEFDAYDTMQIKVVLLSDSDNVVPKADDVRGVLVTS